VFCVHTGALAQAYESEVFGHEKGAFPDAMERKGNSSIDDGVSIPREDRNFGTFDLSETPESSCRARV